MAKPNLLKNRWNDLWPAILSKPQELTDHLIVAGRFGVLKLIGTTPHAGDKLLDELIGWITAIRPLPRQVQPLKATVEIHFVKL